MEICGNLLMTAKFFRLLFSYKKGKQPWERWWYQVFRSIEGGAAMCWLGRTFHCPYSTRTLILVPFAFSDLPVLFGHTFYNIVWRELILFFYLRLHRCRLLHVRLTRDHSYVIKLSFLVLYYWRFGICSNFTNILLLTRHPRCW